MMTGSPSPAMTSTASSCVNPALAHFDAAAAAAPGSSGRSPCPRSRSSMGPIGRDGCQISRIGIHRAFYSSRRVLSCGCGSDVTKISAQSGKRQNAARNCEFASISSAQSLGISGCKYPKLSRNFVVRSKQGSQERREEFLVETDAQESSSEGVSSSSYYVPGENGASTGHDSRQRDSDEAALDSIGESEVGLRRTQSSGRAGDVETDSHSEAADDLDELWNAQSEQSAPLPSTIERDPGKDAELVEDRFRFRNGREVFEERAYLVGVDRKGGGGRAGFGIMDSLEELKQLADTAGLAVVGSTYQKLETPNPRTYIGGGKVAELKTAVQAFKVESVIFDDELSPGQARSLEKALGNVRVCDRTALILDIFSQRAATREATLQVELAQFEYQLPRLTKMWTHLERQAGGMVKGMGEKQIEVDKRILRTRMAALRKNLESVRQHRQQYRDRRAAVPIPVISLVGHTNAGKSTFLNRLSGAEVLAEDRLFATLDPTTRRVVLSNGKDCLFTDTVGFIQKLPTQLVASFRATLEEITDSSLIVHMVDISHPMAFQQIEVVESVLAELNVSHIPRLTVWNKIDAASEPEVLREDAISRGDIVCLSALTGEGMDEFNDAVGQCLKDSMVWVEAVVPYAQGDLVSIIHGLGIVDQEEYMEKGTLMKAYVPLSLSKQLLPFRQACT